MRPLKPYIYSKKNKTTLRFTLALFFTLTLSSFSQITIGGKVIDSKNNTPIPNVSILIKNNIEDFVIDFSTTDKNGKYLINLSRDLDTLFIETSIITHDSKQQVIILEKDKNDYILNFNLSERITALEEVYIESKKKPITTKKDTTIYNVNQFKDGSEDVVEDILKKLPGISISENGSIKFKGKQVVRLLLDNDNIFDSNYTIGTKNIDSEIIEEIQAIEDYNSNPLLKGIKSSDDVALNLVLKKGQADFSGNTEIGIGIKDRKRIKNNNLYVSKKLKGFSTISYNNTGENFSPYNFISNNIELSKINELQQRTNNIINNSGFNSSLPDSRINLNNNLFGSLNMLNKLNEKTSLRINYSLFKDNLKRHETHNTTYQLDNEDLNLLNTKNITKKPTINSINYELIYASNNKSILTSVGKWELQFLKNNTTGINNNISFYDTSKSNDLFLNNNTEYSYKISSNKVFQISSDVAINKIPQEINVRYDSDQYYQKINFEKSYFNLKSSLLTKNKKSEHEIALGYNHIDNYIDSNLTGIDLADLNQSNNISFKQRYIYLNFSSKFKINKWRFGISLYNTLFSYNIEDSNILEKNDNTFFNIRPSIFINRYLNKDSYFYLQYLLLNHIPKAQNIYSGLILVNNRAFINNDFKYNLQNTHTSIFGYRINDFYNLFQFDISAKYSYKKYGFIQQLNITQYLDYYTSILDVTNNKNWNFNLNIEKYVHFLKSTINLKSSYTISDYQNIVNDSDIRDNKNKSLLGQLHIRTGFEKNVNFENKVTLRNNVYSNNLNSSNSFTSFQNELNIIYSKNNFQFSLSNHFFKPNLKSNNSEYLFTDADLTYKNKKGKIEYQLKANNLFNKKVYKDINVSDYSISIFEYNLQDRYFLFSVKFKY